MRAVALLMAVLALAAVGCGKQKKPKTDADKGNPAATQAVKVEGLRVWLDPDATKDYEDSAVAVVHNTSDKLATGVTLKVKWEKPMPYETHQDQAIVLQPDQRGVFLLGPFDAPSGVQGEPKAEVRVDELKAGPKEPVVELDNFKLDDKGSGCDLSGTTSNRFTKAHPGISGLVAGLKDGKVVTGGSVFFEEPGLEPGKDGRFTATLEPLCPEGEVDEWVGYAQLTEKVLADP
jgi:uncharacterized lipoprotein YmbA